MLISSSAALLGAATACLLAPRGVAGQAVAEPAGEQIYLGAWVDTSYGDTPSRYNTRTGYNFSMFQIAIDIPQTPYNYITGAGGPPPEYTIEQTQTSAIVDVTVYPTTFSIHESDLATLALQLKNYTDIYNRTVFLRWAPEMQGVWMVYGQQPTAYLALWKTMYTYIKANAPKVLIVWAPNTGQGYPYGQTFNSVANNPNAAADEALLDTNHDGQLTYLDDPFSPYYPGDDYVDWLGLSIYYKGTNNINVPNYPGFCAEAWASIDSPINYYGPTNFYESYCASKPTKACMFAEAGSAYHVNDTADSNILAMQSAWISSCITNVTFWDQHPRIKAYMHFEFAKFEDDGGIEDYRDYRLTNTSSVLQDYQAALATFSSRVQWATAQAVPSSIPTSGRPGFLPGSNQTVSTVPGIVFQTGRPLDFSNPSLFWSGAERLQIALISSITLSAVALGAATLFTRGSVVAP